MATQSAAPPNASDDKLQKRGAETVQPTNVDQQKAREEPVQQSSTTSAFVNSQPMREEQVQNAVKFLSHPKVRGSPVIYRRSFLEKKGLTKEEIDEAFQRVPDSPANVQTTGENPDGQLKSSANIQQQAQAETLQHGTSASVGATTLGTLSRSRFHWSHAFIAIGLLAASGAGTALLIKNSILPRLKSWIRKVVLEEDDPLKKIDSKPLLAAETAQAAKAAAAAAADVARVSQEMLISQSEERRHFGELVNLVDKQIEEMKLMTNAIRRLEASTGATLLDQEDRRVTQSSSKAQQLIANGKVDYDLHSGRNSSTTTSAELSTAPHPKSYMEIMAMVQRGEKPSNIREINDLPPNPNQQPSNPHMAPRPKPWEVSQVQNVYTQGLQSRVNGVDLNSKVQDTSIQANGDTTVPWWQRENVRNREIDNGNEQRAAPYSVPSAQQPVKRAWVPPQPPPIVMAEAAEAIRRPKPMAQKEQVSDDQSAAHSSGMSDEASRIPKEPESEVAIEGSSLSLVPGLGEVQEA